MHECGAAAAAACDAASSATGRERRRGCRRATRARSLRRRLRPRRAGSMRTFASSCASISFSRPPTPGRVHFDRQEIAGRAAPAAIAAVVSPMPKPISRIFGASRPKTAARSSGAGSVRDAEARQQRVAGALLRRATIRPWRSTKLRIGAARLRAAVRSSSHAPPGCSRRDPRSRSDRVELARNRRRERRPGRREFDRQRVGVLPRRAGIGPGRGGVQRNSLRTPSRVTRQTAISLPQSLRAEVGDGETLPVGREPRFRRQIGDGVRSRAAAARSWRCRRRSCRARPR